MAEREGRLVAAFLDGEAVQIVGRPHCPLCGRGFLSPGYVARHVREMHPTDMERADEPTERP